MQTKFTKLLDRYQILHRKPIRSLKNLLDPEELQETSYFDPEIDYTKKFDQEISIDNPEFPSPDPERCSIDPWMKIGFRMTEVGPQRSQEQIEKQNYYFLD